MSERYPGGLIRKTPPTVTGPTDGEGGSAPGIWTLEEVAYYQKEGQWPKPILPRELYAMGSNQFGQLGNNNLASPYNNVSSPIQVGASVTWLEVAGGDYFSGGISYSNELYTWGRATSYGQLGQNDTIDRSSPTQVGALTNWAKIALGSEEAIALKTDGTIWAWGNNNYGQLGQNNRTLYSSPVQVGTDTDWAEIACGVGVGLNLAIKTNGTMWLIGGRGQDGGLNDLVNRSSPVQIGALTNWSKVDAWAGFTAVKTDGTLWSCGSGGQGIRGDNSVVNLSSPVQVGALTTWSTPARGRLNAGAITTSGELYLWGRNSNGQLGQNNTTYRSSPVQVGALTDWSDLRVNGYGVISVKTDNTLWTWGWNASNGQGGQNTYKDFSSPVQVGSLSTWQKIGSGYRHKFATKT